jgi:nitrous oxidase accessory protein NosD
VTAVHTAGWLHRDLKPANVIVRADGIPVIVDFGATLPIGQADNPPDSDLTDGYGAPEQYLTDQPEGPWTDVYGLGAIAYRALCGRPPAPAPERIRGEPMPLAMDRAGKHAESLCRAVDWALALDLAARPQTVADWSAALSISAEDVSVPTAAGVAPPVATAGAPAPQDKYPPTVRIRRAPSVKPKAAPIAMPPVAAPGATRRRTGLVLAAVLLSALGAGALAAAWYGQPLYERYLKTDWVVDPSGSGDARSIADAIARAGDSATIAIRPGTYDESLMIEGPIHLVPAVPETPPLIAPSAGACVVAIGDGGSISGLRFAGARAADPESVAEPCLLLANAGVRVAGNQISGGAGPAIMIRDGGSPEIADNVLENGGGPGIVVTAGATPRVLRNRVTGVERSALIARGGAAPTIVDNTFEDSGGLVFAEGATGRLEGNRIGASTTSGIEVITGAAPTVIENTIERAAGAGIFVYDHGRGRFERNFILGSALSGVVIATGGDAQLAGNVIRESGEHGVLIVEGGRAVLERNAVADNKGNGIVIDHQGEARLADNELSGNADPQLVDAHAP